MTQHIDQGVALITGASSGIGATYADRLAKRGYSLILVARDLARLNQQAAKLSRETGVNIEILQADLTVKTDLGRVAKRLVDDSRITMLINNAGIAMSGDLVDADTDRLEQMILLNVLAPSLLAHAVIPGFVEHGRGTIINVSSVLALAPELFNGSYSGTKAYLLNLSLRLQQELAGKGVRVQVVMPGATRTEIWEKSGVDIAAFPPSMLMDVDDMVDAALVGLDHGESVTIPSLPEVVDWEAFTSARLALGPNLSRDRAASRYLLAAQ